MSSSRRRFLQTSGISAVGSFLTPTILKNMEQKLFTTAGGLEIIPAKTSSQTDFDFWIGKWRIHNKKLKTRLNNCKEWLEFEATGEAFKILNGFGNFDQFRATFDGAPFEGVTFRLFNPKTKLWSLYWADSNVVVLDVPQVGSFDGRLGKFSRRTFLKESLSPSCFSGTRRTLMFRFGVRPSRPITAKRGNGIGI
jgi:hypothetical protein